MNEPTSPPHLCHGQYKTTTSENICHERRLLLAYKKERFESNDDGFLNTKYKIINIENRLYTTRINVELEKMEFENEEFLEKLEIERKLVSKQRLG